MEVVTLENFGGYVKTELKKRNMSQKDLAQQLDISTAYLSDILNDRREAPEQRYKIYMYLRKTKLTKC